jgi:nitrite reductase/ring-hydroxylating ferredoxin subunit/uncharacterized membrane protein
MTDIHPSPAPPRLGGLLDILDRADGLDPVAERLRDAGFGIFRPTRLRDALHGVWLGHPLHPALAQLTLGCWTSAVLVDLTGSGQRAATMLIGTGVAAATPTAAAGLADYSTLHPDQMRVGLVHALTNGTALGLYSASLYQRLRGRTALGRALSAAGLAVAGTGGLLGGHLAYRKAAGANQAEEVIHVLSSGWHPIGPRSELPDGTPVRRMIGEVPAFVLRSGERIDAIADRCSHQSGPLHEGGVTGWGDRACVRCPWHGSVFRLVDGSVVTGPATAPQPRFEVRTVEGVVELRLPGAEG